MVRNISNGKNLLVYEEPSSSVHQETGIALELVSFSSHHVLDLHLTRGQEVHSWDRFVSNGHLSLQGLDVES